MIFAYPPDWGRLSAGAPREVGHGGILCVIGNGVVMDPVAFEKEVSELQALGVETGDSLVISGRAHLILPHHRALEALSEEERGERKIGTTLRGIGPAYEDKAGRRGVTLGDLRRPAGREDKLAEARRHYEHVLRGAGRAPEVDWKRLVSDLTAFGERHRSRIVDASLVLHRQIAQGYSILFEGAQAALLDLDHGSYPYVTSSNTVASGACTGSAIAPSQITFVVGIAKAYTTRVGGGPFPTELSDALGRKLQQDGDEFGATTGRPRRCGWFDAVVVRRPWNSTAWGDWLTKLDVLTGIDPIRVCVAYRAGDELLHHIPADVERLARCHPVYEEFPGWQTPTDQARRWEDLPVNCRHYLLSIAQLSAARLVIASVGPGRGCSCAS